MISGVNLPFDFVLKNSSLIASAIGNAAIASKYFTVKWKLDRYSHPLIPFVFAYYAPLYFNFYANMGKKMKKISEKIIDYNLGRQRNIQV